MVASFLSSFPPTTVVFTMYSQHTNDSQHADEEITVETLRISNDDGSILKEKYDLEVQTPVEAISSQNSDDDHPDGGLTAWLIVAGVRLFLYSIVSSQSYDPSPPSFLRRCVIHARRKYFNRLMSDLISFSSFRGRKTACYCHIHHLIFFL